MADTHGVLRRVPDANSSGSWDPATEIMEDVQKYFESHKDKRDFPGHTSKVHSVAWSCEGKWLASGSLDKTVGVFHLERSKLSKDTALKGHSDSVDQICWSPTHPNQLVSASGDKTVKVWDVRAGKCTHTVQTKGENINLCWSPNGQAIAVGNKEDVITIIDTKSYKIIHEEQFKYEVNEMSFNCSSSQLYMTNGLGCITVLSHPKMAHLHTINAHPANCICIDFDPTGRYFATGSADALVSLWDCDELVCIRTFSRLDWPVRSVSFSGDGQLLASGSEDLNIDIGYVENGDKVTEVPVSAATFAVAWHPKEKLLAYACDDKDRHNRDSGTVWLFGLPS